MKSLKKTLAMVACVAMAGSVMTACGGNTATDTASTTAAAGGDAAETTAAAEGGDPHGLQLPDLQRAGAARGELDHSGHLRL